MFSEAQQRALVEIARSAVHQAIAGTRPEADLRQGDGGHAPRPEDLEGLPAASGAFVTLKRDGQLRGCIGTLQCRAPLPEEIARVAVSAAREDPRFDAVRPGELDDLDVEVSVLGPLEEIDPRDPAAIEIGRHGLVVEQGHRRGLLLPQVATEWGWDRDKFLAQTCVKAGLPSDCWQRGAKVYRFAADVFGD